MSKKEDVTYILKHKKTSLLVKQNTGELVLTDMITKAKRFETNNPSNDKRFSELIQSGNFSVLKRTETTIIDYEEVEL